MHFKAHLKKLHWQTVAAIGAAFLLLAFSLWFGSSSSYTGRVTDLNINPRLVAQNVNTSTSIWPNPSFLSAMSVSPSCARVGARTPMYVSYTVNRTPVYKVVVAVEDVYGRPVMYNVESIASRIAASYPNSSFWNGTGNSPYYSGDVPAGQYWVTVKADGYAPVKQAVTISNSADCGSVPGSPIFRDSYMVPSNGTINADNRENIYGYFYLNRPAYVTAEIFSDAGNRYIVMKDQEYISNLGQQISVSWHGQFSNVDNPVDAGSYYLKLTARDVSGVTDEKRFNVTVTRFGANANFQLDGVSMYPTSFDSRISSRMSFTFTLNKPNVSSVIANVYDGTGTRLVAQIIPAPTYNGSSTGSTFIATWDGIDRTFNLPAFPGTYRLKIQATSPQYGTVNTDRDFQVLYTSGATPGNPCSVYDPTCDPYIRPYNPVSARCGNFSDLALNDSRCAAVQFAVSKGFITGYNNGTIGLDNTIKRAEYLAIIQSAFKYTLLPYNPFYDSNLGFRDLIGKQNEWYMKYLLTFSRLGIMTGYPDRTMHPERTMTRAELYVSLFRAAMESPNRAARFSLPLLTEIHFKPYDDTPRNDNTEWFIRHAEFARRYGLVTGSKFHPSQAITRGQVVKLIYDMYQKGLLSL